jgi:hypothetical protein
MNYPAMLMDLFGLFMTTSGLLMKLMGNRRRNGYTDFLGVLTENNLLHIKLPFPMTGKQITANGLYINYLHVGNLVVVPQFNMKEDKIANHKSILKGEEHVFLAD